MALHHPSYAESTGFTLIEVLIALAILSIALTAIIKITSQNIKDTAYLQDKTIANWVGLKVMNEARVGFLNLPPSAEPVLEEVTLMGNTWRSAVSATPTSNPHIVEITVDVYRTSDNTNVIHLTGYRYAPKIS